MNSRHAARAQRIKERDRRVEEIILRELEDGAKQAWPILETVKRHLTDVPERMVLRRIYTIMGVDTDLIPDSQENDYILL